MPIKFNDLEASKRRISSFSTADEEDSHTKYERVDPSPVLGAELALCIRPSGTAVETQQRFSSLIDCDLGVNDIGILLCNTSAAQELLCTCSVEANAVQDVEVEIKWLRPVEPRSVVLPPATSRLFSERVFNELIHLSIEASSRASTVRRTRVEVRVCVELTNGVFQCQCNFNLAADVDVVPGRVRWR